MPSDPPPDSKASTVHRVADGTDRDIVVLIPVFNDWDALVALLADLDDHVGGRPTRVLIVDDGSTSPAPEPGEVAPLTNLSVVEVVRLRLNLGHQRAIAVGLSVVVSRITCRAVLVMDGDGEDAPEDVPRLLDELDRTDDGAVVFAQRTKRSERWAFRIGYRAYRLVHRPLTGISVKVGNFSVVPSQYVTGLVLSSDLWNHYAAAVVRSRVPVAMVPTVRANRIAGASTMNVVSLVAHGFSAMAVFGDRVAVRMLAAAGGLLALLSAAVVVLAAVDAGAGWDVPWGAPQAVVAAVATVQLLALLVVFAFVVLGTRNQSGFVPLRDHELFVGRTWELACR